MRNGQIVGKSSDDNEDTVAAHDVVKKRKVFVDAANEYEDTGKADEDNEVAEKVRERYRVTISLVQNLLLTTKQKFRFGLARAGQVRPKRNFCSDVNGRF